MDERLKIIHIALDKTKGRIPVLGGIIAEFDLVRNRTRQHSKNHGVDGVLVCAPTILAWDAGSADKMLLAHFCAIDKEVGLPFIIYGGPGPGEGSTCRQLPSTFTKVATACENLAAWKIPIKGVTKGKNWLEACVSALDQVKATTGRTVSPLLAAISTRLARSSPARKAM